MREDDSHGMERNAGLGDEPDWMVVTAKATRSDSKTMIET
jgi:hypothetical protein